MTTIMSRLPEIAKDIYQSHRTDHHLYAQSAGEQQTVH